MDGKNCKASNCVSQLVYSIDLYTMFYSWVWLLCSESILHVFLWRNVWSSSILQICVVPQDHVVKWVRCHPCILDTWMVGGDVYRHDRLQICPCMYWQNWRLLLSPWHFPSFVDNVVLSNWKLFLVRMHFNNFISEMFEGLISVFGLNFSKASLAAWIPEGVGMLMYNDISSRVTS